MNFGSAMNDASNRIETVLGQLERDAGWRPRECGSGQVRRVRWGDFTAMFTDTTGEPRFSGWLYGDPYETEPGDGRPTQPALDFEVELLQRPVPVSDLPSRLKSVSSGTVDYWAPDDGHRLVITYNADRSAKLDVAVDVARGEVIVGGTAAFWLDPRSVC